MDCRDVTIAGGGLNTAEGVKQAPEAEQRSGAAIYKDDWWAQNWLDQLAAASKYSAILSSIALDDSPEEAQTKAELGKILRLQMSAELAARKPEIQEEADGPPSYYSRMLFLDKQRNGENGKLLFTAAEWSTPFIMHFKRK